jgi:hypothetical protein
VYRGLCCPYRGAIFASGTLFIRWPRDVDIPLVRSSEVMCRVKLGEERCTGKATKETDKRLCIFEKTSMRTEFCAG